jgi:hypothetical protein
VKAPGERLGYVYNLGMFWNHVITVEAVLPPPARAAVPQVCSPSPWLSLPLKVLEQVALEPE